MNSETLGIKLIIAIEESGASIDDTMSCLLSMACFTMARKIREIDGSVDVKKMAMVRSISVMHKDIDDRLEPSLAFIAS